LAQCGHGHAAAFTLFDREHYVQSSRLINRNIVAERGRTSMRLEPEVWDALAEICRREGQDLNGLVRQIEMAAHAGSRTSAVRVFVLQYFRSAAIDVGHEHASDDALCPVTLLTPAAT
jgi:predicted DNA-binding ribbon-helix-helix protein